MSDSLGVLTLPVAAPVVDPPTERTAAPGDPALAYVGSFAATVLQADCGAAWAAMVGDRPVILEGVDAERDGVTVARRVLYSDPRKGYFNDADLPALFVYRKGDASYLRFGADVYRRKWPIAIAWIPPQADADQRFRERDAFVNAIAASLHRNIIFARHRAWILDSDLASPAGLLAAAVPTSTSTATITTFNGALAGSKLKPGRPIQIITSVASGAYNTTDPIQVTGTLDSGATFTDKLYLTNANGGETIIGMWSFATPTRLVIPAQLLTTGAFTFGYYDSPDVKLGSLVQRAAGFLEFRPRSVSTVAIRVAMPVGDPMMHVAAEAVIDVTEEIEFDLAEHAQALPDPTVTPGLDAFFLQGNNDPFNSFSL